MTGEYFDASFSMKGSSGACSPCGSSSIDLRSFVLSWRRVENRLTGDDGNANGRRPIFKMENDRF
jgi:hypothetical protein